MDETEEQPWKNWWVHIRYDNDGLAENLPITNVTDLCPSSLEDFDPNKLVEVRTTTWNDEGREECYWGYITRIETSKENLIESLEREAPIKTEREEDDSANFSETEDVNEEQPTMEIGRKKRRGGSTSIDWTSFLTSHEPSVKISTTDYHHNVTVKEEHEDHSEIENLKAKIEMLEQQLQEERKLRIAAETKANSLSSSPSLTDVIKRLEGIEKTVMQDQCYQYDQRNTTSAITAALISSSMNSSVSSSCDNTLYGQLIINDQVHLGKGFHCDATCWKKMNTTDNITSWCKAILVGVFGEEEAKYYRVAPRKAENKRFPASFLEVAKVHFESFLIKKNYTNPAKANAVKALPSWLSDRAIDMCGRRGGPRCLSSAAAPKRKKPNDSQMELDAETGELRPVKNPDGDCLPVDNETSFPEPVKSES